MRNLTEVNPDIRVVSDQVGTPTNAADLAGLIMKIIQEKLTDKCGIWHYTDEGCTSWYDLAVAVNELSAHKCQITPCRTEDYPTKARRPHYSVLDKTKVKEDFGIIIPHWFSSLKECMLRIEKAEKEQGCQSLAISSVKMAVILSAAASAALTISSPSVIYPS